MVELLQIIIGFFTGLIDSVVGGGGLISLPSISFFLGPGVQSIATNKVLGSVGASVALYVYAKKGFLPLKKALLFCVIAGIGSFLGSSSAHYIDSRFFRYLFLLICPLILCLILKKDSLLDEKKVKSDNKVLFLLGGLFAGFYDGFFGPGGGTIMFLSIFLFTPYSLLHSIAISKLANTFSATTALISFSFQDVINWKLGLTMAIGMVFGAFMGAHLTVKKSTLIIRPLLILIVSLLFFKLLFNY